MYVAEISDRLKECVDEWRNKDSRESLEYIFLFS